MWTARTALGVGFEHVVHTISVATGFITTPSESWGLGPFQKSHLGLCSVTIVSYDIHERRRLRRSGFQLARQRFAPLERRLSILFGASEAPACLLPTSNFLLPTTYHVLCTAFRAPPPPGLCVRRVGRLQLGPTIGNTSRSVCDRCGGAFADPGEPHCCPAAVRDGRQRTRQATTSSNTRKRVD